MTAQIPDVLIHRGQRLSLCYLPLEDYFKQCCRGRRPNFFVPSSALWRGYIATWEILDAKLYLVGIKGKLRRGRKNQTLEEATLGNVVRKLATPIVADWIEYEELRCPEGPCLTYRHAAFASVYERDRLFLINKGTVVDEWLRLNPPDPIFYRIASDGSRTRFDMMYGDGELLDDPFPPDAMPQGHVIWGRPPPQSSDEGYMLAGAFCYGFEASSHKAE